MSTKKKYPTVPHTRTKPNAWGPASRKLARLTEITMGRTAAPKNARAKVASTIATKPFAPASHKYPSAEPTDRNATMRLLAPVRSATCPHSRSEEHTSELQSRVELLCRRLT